MNKIKIKSIYFLRLLRNLFMLIGIFFSVCIILAFTAQPYWAYHWLGTSKSKIQWEPEAIVLLGGGGMPSQSTLIRSWYAAEAAKSFPDADIVIAIPGDVTDGLSTPMLLGEELLIRGIDASKIKFENVGTNTRSQALECQGLIKMQAPILLITSPEHMRRAILSFEKVGFEKVNGLPAFENAIEADLEFDDDELGGKKTLVPNVGKSISMRYQIWNHLKYEIIVSRELVALSYYKLRGWI